MLCRAFYGVALASPKEEPGCFVPRFCRILRSPNLFFGFPLLQVAEMKKIQCAGGTLQGEANPTWLKQGSADRIWAAAGLALALMGTARATMCSYRLASGKGKIED